MSTPVYSRENIGEVGIGPAWREYRKHATTWAMRIEGPFEVETSEGNLRCEDGYLAVDARGYPYPIAADEFALIYTPKEAS